jgi:hypothetical protein
MQTERAELSKASNHFGARKQTERIICGGGVANSRKLFGSLVK